MKRLQWLVGVIVFSAVLGVFAWGPAFIHRLEFQTYDWRFRLRGQQEPKAPVSIVAIDARSVDELGRWPWRRSHIAKLVKRLSDAGVQAIGFDVVFSEPETPPEIAPLRAVVAHLTDGGRADDDQVVMVLDRALQAADTDTRLEQAIRDSDRVVAGYFFRTAQDESIEGRGRVDLPLEQSLPMVRKSRLLVTRVPEEIGNAPLLECSSVEPNLDRFNRAARRMGFFNARPDPDGVVRRTSLIARCGGEYYKALSLAMYELSVGKKAQLVWEPERKVVEGLKVGDDMLPIDEGGRVLVNWRGKAQTFPHYSAVDVILGRVPDEKLKDQLVLIGPTEIGIGDLWPTPFANNAPGVEVHATVLENMLSSDVLLRRDDLVTAEVLAVACLSLITLIAVPLLGTAVRGAIFSFCLAGSVLALVTWLFMEHGIVVKLAYPVLAVAVSYLAMAVTRSSASEAQARFIRETFAQFVPPDVVSEMIQDPASFVMGGQRRDLSLLFSDIRSFTTISEDLGPSDTTKLLNEYLTPMTRIVFESRGTLDKYIGDAVVAFWNAPLDVDDHPLRAAEAAIAMQEATRQMREGRPDLVGAERLAIGIGIHSAEVNVGLMGSDQRVDYTVTGDGVNLCARLEGMTKQYGAEIVTSKELVNRLPANSHFLHRKLDVIRVKGKHEPVEIYQILGQRDAEPGEKEWLEIHAAALESYAKGDFTAAVRLFEQARAAHEGGDKSCDLLLDRLEHLQANPPSDWEGIWTFETK
jgi:adenylate cyclase